ncbi:MAG: ATP-binding protein, partial [Acidobacteriota bacterium]|nr:ATP-binding protein [Acidobacteriota bacterium]
MEQAASSRAGDTADIDPLAAALPALGPMHHLKIEGLSVGLMLLVDEYLTTLAQELGMIRLDHRPTAGSDAAESLELIDSILGAYGVTRDMARRQAEIAYDAGRDTFDIELEVPEVAATAAVALERALREIQELSRQGRILLPPLEPVAAQQFSVFLLSTAYQILGEETVDELVRAPLAEVPAVLEDRPLRPARFVGASRAGAERRRASASFDRDLVSAKVARRFVVDTLRRWGYEAQADRAELPVAELLANALLHSRQGLDVVLVAGEQSVRVEVHDRAGARPILRRRGTGADSGRGLILVDALVDRWGCDDESEMAKRVWVEFDLETAGEGAADGDDGPPGAGRADPPGTAVLGTLSEAEVYLSVLDGLDDTTVFVFVPDLRYVAVAGA